MNQLAEIPWRAVVVDEAHRLKNTASKLLDCMRAVVAKGMTAYGYQVITPLLTTRNHTYSPSLP